MLFELSFMGPKGLILYLAFTAVHDPDEELTLQPRSYFIARALLCADLYDLSLECILFFYIW